jgi:hypothetical protein
MVKVKSYGVGGALTAGAKRGNYEEVTETAKVKFHVFRRLSRKVFEDKSN